jgi:hypothetical protein
VVRRRPDQVVYRMAIDIAVYIRYNSYRYVFAALAVPPPPGNSPPSLGGPMPRHKSSALSLELIAPAICRNEAGMSMKTKDRTLDNSALSLGERAGALVRNEAGMSMKTKDRALDDSALSLGERVDRRGAFTSRAGTGEGSLPLLGPATRPCLVLVPGQTNPSPVRLLLVKTPQPDTLSPRERAGAIVRNEAGMSMKTLPLIHRCGRRFPGTLLPSW